MKTVYVILLILLAQSCVSQKNKPTIKSILLEQLENTHNKQSWFVLINKAVSNLTAEQADWKDEKANHSIAELVSHLTFWNKSELLAFKGYTLQDFNDDNDGTFKRFKKNDWINATKTLDSIQTLWIQLVENTTDKQPTEWSSEIANMCSHNAYQTGQIVYIRKQKGCLK